MCDSSFRHFFLFLRHGSYQSFIDIAKVTLHALVWHILESCPASVTPQDEIGSPLIKDLNEQLTVPPKWLSRISEKFESFLGNKSLVLDI